MSAPEAPAGRPRRVDTANMRGAWQVLAEVVITPSDYRGERSQAREAVGGVVLGTADSILDLTDLAETLDRLPAVDRVAITKTPRTNPPGPTELSELAMLVRAAANVR